jgi:hypothetical protein
MERAQGQKIGVARAGADEKHRFRFPRAAFAGARRLHLRADRGIIANVFPRFAETIKEAVRPELYIKIAIVILGGFFAVTAAGKLNLATSLLLRGAAAIIEAYLIYWAVVYFVARKWFGVNREWAAPLASGISICGVSAAIATAARSVRGRSYRCWSPRWSSSSRWSRY